LKPVVAKSSDHMKIETSICMEKDPQVLYISYVTGPGSAPPMDLQGATTRDLVLTCPCFGFCDDGDCFAGAQEYVFKVTNHHYSSIPGLLEASVPMLLWVE
jgi:hypothetical protein